MDFVVAVVCIFIIALILKYGNTVIYGKKQHQLLAWVAKQSNGYMLIPGVLHEGFPNRGKGTIYSDVLLMENNIFLLTYSKIFSWKIRNIIYRINYRKKSNLQLNDCGSLNLITNEILLRGNLVYISFPKRNGIRLLADQRSDTLSDHINYYIKPNKER